GAWRIACNAVPAAMGAPLSVARRAPIGNLSARHRSNSETKAPDPGRLLTLGKFTFLPSGSCVYDGTAMTPSVLPTQPLGMRNGRAERRAAYRVALSLAKTPA